MRVPTEEEIRFVVSQVVVEEVLPLDVALTQAIWAGEEPPEIWGDWPPEAIEAWSMGCDLYSEMKHGLLLSKSWSRNCLTLEVSWSAVLALSPGGSTRWWDLSGVTWADFGRRLATTPRKAAYRMRSLGWRFVGRGMNVPDRRIVRAPCRNCGSIWTPYEFSDYRGPCCEG